MNTRQVIKLLREYGPGRMLTARDPITTYMRTDRTTVLAWLTATCPFLTFDVTEEGKSRIYGEGGELILVIQWI